MQPGTNQPRQMTPRPQIQSPGPHFNNGGQFPPRMPQNQFQGTPQFRGEYFLSYHPLLSLFHYYSV